MHFLKYPKTTLRRQTVKRWVKTKIIFSTKQNPRNYNKTALPAIAKPVLLSILPVKMLGSNHNAAGIRPVKRNIRS